MLCSTLTILQRERRSLFEIQIESTALLAYRRQRFLITTGFCLFFVACSQRGTSVVHVRYGKSLAKTY